MESLPLGWWDGQPIHVTVMIREIHGALNRSRAFKFQDLADQLADRGYVVDDAGMVSPQNLSAPSRTR